MPKTNWNLEQLKSQLNARKQIKGWVVTQEDVRRRERYFLLERERLAIDQDRDVHSQNVVAKILVHLPTPGRQGEITKKLFKALPLQPQLDAAVEAALQTDHQAWELPSSVPADLPQLQTSDPAIAEDIEKAMRQLTEKIDQCVSRKRRTTFNSSELFLSIHNRELHLSNGLTHRSSQTRVYSEAAFSMSGRSAQGDEHSDEYQSSRWSVSMDDLRVEELFEQTTKRAEWMVQVGRPVAGRYRVLVDADVLATLFNGYVNQLSAAHEYHGLPFIKPGSPLIHDARGDLITLTLDPTLPFGGDTLTLSEHGVAQLPLTLVERNKVMQTATDKQFADYTAKAPTTSRGNIVLAPGTLSHEELTRFAPRVIEILQFSGLFADPNTGTFSSEIRLARLFDNEKKTVSYLKGGSLSGSIQENFADVRFSRERVKHAHFSANAMRGEGYHGPAYALLNEVSIVG